MLRKIACLLQITFQTPGVSICNVNIMKNPVETSPIYTKLAIYFFPLLLFFLSVDQYIITWNSLTMKVKQSNDTEVYNTRLSLLVISNIMLV